MSRKDIGQAGRSPILWAALRLLRRFVVPITAAVVVSAVFLYAFHRFEDFLLQDARFIVRVRGDLPGDSGSLMIHGASPDTTPQVRAVFDADHGRSLYLLPLGQRRMQVRAISWVRDASVARYWPNRVEIFVRRRQPVAYAQLPLPGQRGAHRVMAVDEEGVLLDRSIAAGSDLPVLAGLRDDQTLRERALRIRLMMRVVAEIGERSRDVSVIDVAQLDNVRLTMHMDEMLLVLVFGPDEFGRKLSQFLRFYPEIRTRIRSGAVIDLRIRDRATVLEEGKETPKDGQ